CTRQQSNHDVW
nr:immunoglobulin heavy chain junction region [Macaca mulatta]MOX65685.1 immunoglobulin heavy chain junction region [Macaca mulatta]MOX66968.1 immunoglobulin heavy chain junction region [Macaca mulatta]MOX67245.1 immunoglobulin heavy chain junction region [Macaca mulatta]MOX67546.1 immunoglobulin heavy chain junction region [Macaca mulatta]